jgi:hypothetical protein
MAACEFICNKSNLFHRPRYFLGLEGCFKSALIFPPLPLTLFNKYDFITSRYFQVTCHYSFQCRFNAVFNPLLERPLRQRKGIASYENSMFMQTADK